MAETKSGGISPALMITGAVGLGLIIFGLSKLGGPKASGINAKFNFSHVGPKQDVKFSTKFGADDIMGFRVNSDLVQVSDIYHVAAHDVPTPVEVNVKVTILAKSNLLFPLPFTYDAEAQILDTAGNVVEHGEVVTDNVFTHMKDFQVVML